MYRRGSGSATPSLSTYVDSRRLAPPLGIGLPVAAGAWPLAEDGSLGATAVSVGVAGAVGWGARFDPNCVLVRWEALGPPLLV
jgi:hypothetical protein